MALPAKLKNFALFNAGLSYLGEVAEVTLPKLARKTEEYRAGGMPGPIKNDLGLEAMEMEWTANGFLRSLLVQFGMLQHDGVQLRFAGALQSGDSEVVQALEVVVRGRHTEIDFGTAKAGGDTEIKVKTAVSYYRLTLNGEVLIEIDFPNMIENVGGFDRMLLVKAAIALA